MQKYLKKANYPQSILSKISGTIFDKKLFNFILKKKAFSYNEIIKNHNVLQGKNIMKISAGRSLILNLKQSIYHLLSTVYEQTA